MEEAEQLCDYIVIMDNGTVLKEGTLRELLNDESGEKKKNLDDLFISLTGRKINEEAG
jgi:ABC-2 type transport system ATP-binding protein